jgi:hypothetical protein
MPIRKAPGGRSYYLISFDKQGRERNDPDAGGGRLSEVAMSDLAAAGASDVFIVSHGWKGDVPSAIDQYDRWIGEMTRDTADLDRMKSKYPNYKPFIIGLHWPSQPWGDEEMGGLNSFAASAAAAGGEFDSPRPWTIDDLVISYTDRLSDTDDRASDEWRNIEAEIRTVVEEARVNPNPSKLPAQIAEAYTTLDGLAGLGNSSLAGEPGSDREPFDPVRAYKATQSATGAFGGGILDNLLSPLRQLSFWKMKKRAQVFGESGAAGILSLIQARSPQARVHAAGHSFGCIVVSGMLKGSAGAGGQPIHSATLIQGALSLWSYCSSIEKADGKPGYFWPVLARARVKGPFLTTQSRFDRAVGFWYPKAAGVAGQVAYTTDLGELPKYGGVGTFGLQGPSVPVESMNMLPADGTYAFQPGKIYNINAEKYIKTGDVFSGAHSDIAHPEVAHAIWEAVLTD